MPLSAILPAGKPEKWIAWLILTAGAALRLVVWLQNRSLFIDEANLARNIAEKPLPDLLAGALAYDQYAPPLFLALVKLCYFLFGGAEPALRLAPLLSGLLSLYLLLRIGRVWLGNYWWTAFLLWMLAFSPEMLRYGTALKQYASDVAVALLLLWAAHRHPPGTDTRNKVHWSLFGALSLWLSMPAVFILTGVGLFGLKRNGWRKTLPIGLTWFLSFAAYYWLILRSDLSRPELFDYHREYFLPVSFASADDWRKLGLILWSILRTAFGHTVLALITGGGLIVAGLVHFFRREKSWLWLLTPPLLTCGLASALSFYSLMPRLTLFFIPILWLTAAFGARSLWRSSNRVVQFLTVVLILLLLPLQQGYRYFAEPYEIEALKPVMNRLLEKQATGDQIYVHHEAVPALSYYREHHPHWKEARFVPIYLARWSDRPETQLAKLSGDETLWLVFSHLLSDESRRQRDQLLEEMQREAKIVYRYRATGAELYGLRKL